MDDVATDEPRYLSDAWVREQHEWLEETHAGPDSGDCGGWTWDPPCGGCGRCMHMQLSHSIDQEKDRARTFQRAGFEAAPPTLIVIEWQAGFEGGHDSYNCKQSGELYDYRFPWEKKGS